MQKAIYSLVRATYQKGEKKDQYSGAIYYRGKPRWGMNDKYKAKLIPSMLAKSLRWNDELKLYSGQDLDGGAGAAHSRRHAPGLRR